MPCGFVSITSNITEDDYVETVDYLLDFLNELGSVRPNEIALLSVAKRQQARNANIGAGISICRSECRQEQFGIWHPIK